MENKSSWDKGFGKVATRSAQTLLITALAAVLVFALIQLQLVILPIIIAIILAATISPLVSFMEKFKIKRGTGSALTILTVVASLGFIGYFIVTSVQAEIAAQSESLSAKFDEAMKWVRSGNLPVSGEQVDTILNASRQYLSSPAFGQGALQFSGTLTSMLAGLFLTLLILFFFLKDGEKIFSFLVRFIKPDLREKTHEAGVKATTVLGGYIRGTTIVALVDAVLIGIGLVVMDVPLVIPLCLLVIFGAFVPYIGSISAGTVISLVALVATDLHTAIIVAIIVLAVNQIEGLLSPFILGNILNMSALAILLSLSVGAILGGIVGALVSVPLAAVAWVVWKTWNEPEDDEVVNAAVEDTDSDSKSGSESDDKSDSVEA